MTGYADYLFLLSPPQPVIDEVARYKKASAKYIGDFSSMNAPAHISVMTAERQKPYFAENALSKIEQELVNMPPIVLHLDGFRYFDHLHDKKTIYAVVRYTKSVDNWFELVKKKIGMKKAIVPHITICRNITKEQFEILWPHFRHKKFVEPFWAKNLTITSRETFGPNSKWQTAKNISFKPFRSGRSSDNKLDGNEQMNLF